jgi:hypothetical protein
MPQRIRPELDPGKVLYVRPGRKKPWRVLIQPKRIKDKSFQWGGNGQHVEYARHSVIRERDSRKEHYRWGGHNQKGHGGGRARSVWTKLSSQWRDFTKRYNNEVTRSIVRLAVSRGCGRIVYLQPTDKRRDNRYLSVAGNERNWVRITTCSAWPWHTY